MAFLDSPWPAYKGNKPPQLPFIGYTLHSKYRWNTLSSLVFVCVCVRESITYLTPTLSPSIPPASKAVSGEGVEEGGRE